MNDDRLAELDAFRLVDLLFEETAAARRVEFTETPESALTWRGIGPPIAMPAKSPANMGLEDALARRVSVRNYARQPVPLAAVTSMLEAAHGFDEHTWPERSRAGPSLSLLLLARRVSDLAPAVYAYVPQSRTLLPIAPAPDEAASRELFLQEEFASAPVVIVVVVAFAAAVRSAGSHGYRELLVRAGAAAHGAVLAGLRLGLGGCVFAGLLSSGWSTLFGLDGYGRVALFACAVGHPGEDEVEVWRT